MLDRLQILSLPFNEKLGLHETTVGFFVVGDAVFTGLDLYFTYCRIFHLARRNLCVRTLVNHKLLP